MLIFSAIRARSAGVKRDRSACFGRCCGSSGLVFSLLPRCQGNRGIASCEIHHAGPSGKLRRNHAATCSGVARDLPRHRGRRTAVPDRERKPQHGTMSDDGAYPARESARRRLAAVGLQQTARAAIRAGSPARHVPRRRIA